MIFPILVVRKADARVSKAQNPADFVTLDHPSGMIASWNGSDLQEIYELITLSSVAAERMRGNLERQRQTVSCSDLLGELSCIFFY